MATTKGARSGGRGYRNTTVDAYNRAFLDIVEAIVDPTLFAYALYSANLITRMTRESAKNERMQVTDRASMLVSSVHAVITVDPSRLETFVTELRKSGPAGEAVANKFANGDYGPVDLPPPPLPSSPSSDGPRHRHVGQGHDAARRPVDKSGQAAVVQDDGDDDPPARKEATQQTTVVQGSDDPPARRVDTSQQATVAQDGGDGSSMLRDIGQCVLFIGGVSLVMWLGFMIVYTQLPLPSELSASNIYSCIPVKCVDLDRHVLHNLTSLNQTELRDGYQRCSNLTALSRSFDELLRDCEKNETSDCFMKTWLHQWLCQDSSKAGCWEDVLLLLQCLNQRHLLEYIIEHFIMSSS